MALKYRSQCSDAYSGQDSGSCSSGYANSNAYSYSNSGGTQYGYKPQSYLLTESPDRDSAACHYCEMIEAMKQIEEGCCGEESPAESNEDAVYTRAGGPVAEPVNYSNSCATDGRFAAKTETNFCNICPAEFQEAAATTQRKNSRPRLGKCRELEGDPRELRKDPEIECLVQEIKQFDECIDRDSIYSLLEVASHVKFLFDGVNMIRITTPVAVKRRLWADADLYSRIKGFAAEKAKRERGKPRATPGIDEPHAQASEKAVHRVIM